MRIGLLSVIALGLLLALRPAGIGPVALAGYRSDLLGQGKKADAALASLASALEAALDDARRGAAATVSGDGAPGAYFGAAAVRLEEAGQRVTDANGALAGVRGLLAIGGDPGAPLAVASAAELASISAQLQATAQPADAFAAMRRSSREVLNALQASLAALRGDDLATAQVGLDRAATELDAVRGWPGQLATLPLWTTTVGKLLDALVEVVDARRAGDATREKAALAAYRAATKDAAQADRALAIALAEGGGGISQVPLSRLAAAVANVEAARGAVASRVLGG